MEYGKNFSGKKTVQTEKIPGKEQVKNNEGGYVFSISPEQRIRRFLMLGTDTNSFYQSKENLTIENATCIVDEIKKGNGKKVIDMVIDISENGLARKNEPCIFALALGLTYGDNELKNYIVDNFNKVVRIGTHLFQFIHTLKQLRGFGKITKKVFSKWMIEKPLSNLAYQVIKYQGRTVEEGNQSSKWTFRDILRLMKFKTNEPQRDNLFHYITKNSFKIESDESLKIIEGFEKAKACKSEKEILPIIQTYGLTREMIPTEFLNQPKVQEYIFENSGLIAIIRSLSTWTASGLLNDYNIVFLNKVIDKLLNKELLKSSRIHPLQILDAIFTYSGGHSIKGSSSWTPVRKIADSLNQAFYLSFENVEPTNKKIMLAIDCSGSMSWPSSRISGSLLTARDVSAVMALVTAKSEKNYIIKGFSEEMSTLDISPNMDLNQVVSNMNKIQKRGTDCAIPIIDAMKNNCYDIDAFVIYTDNETWFGDIHPCQALTNYRNKSGKSCKFITVGMSATNFTIADPNDKDMFDVVGCSTDLPRMISDIIMENI